MGTYLISIGHAFVTLLLNLLPLLVLFLVAFINSRRRQRRGGSQPMPPQQAGSSEWPSAKTSGMGHGPQPPFNSPQPQPPAQPGPFYFFKLIAPSRPTRILLGVAALLVLAGLVIMIIALQTPDAPNILPRVLTGVAPTVLGGLIWTYLLISASLRQGRGQRPKGLPQGWTPVAAGARLQQTHGRIRHGAWTSSQTFERSNSPLSPTPAHTEAGDPASAATQPVPGSGARHITQPPSLDTVRNASRRWLGRRCRNAVIAALIPLAIAAVGITGCSVKTPPSPNATAPSSTSTGPTTPSYAPAPASRQSVLPFTGLDDPGGVAVDTAGNVYLADRNNSQVLKLAAGSNTPTVLPFTGLHNPADVAVDTAGNVYVADNGNFRVVKLAAGSNAQTVLPFTGLDLPVGVGVAVDTAGNVYSVGYTIANGQVVRLAAGANTPTVLPFTGLHNPGGVAVDTAGTVYVADVGHDRVLMLAAGSSIATVLPFSGLNYPHAVAVDAANNVYVLDHNPRVVKLAAGSNTQTVLPFTGLQETGRVAVDTAGNVYVTDTSNDTVLKLSAG